MDREATLRSIIAFQNRIIAGALGLEAVFANVVHDLPKLIPASHGGVIELRDSDMMVYRAASGTAAHHIGLSLPVEGSLSGLCVMRGALLYAKDCTTDQRVDRKACEWLKIKSMICCPVMIDDVAVGVLKSFSAELNAYDGADYEIVKLVSEIVGAAIVQETVQQAEDHVARVDALTGVGNRRAFDEDLERIVAEARRVDRPLVVAVIECADQSDAALANAARVIASEIGEGDRAYRIGGEAFALILPNMRSDRSSALIEKMVASAKDIHISGQPISLAVGVAELLPADSAEVLFKRSNEAMHADKTRSKSIV